MAKRRTSRKLKRNSRKRTSRRNSPLHGVPGRARKLDQAADLVATWKRSYVQKYGNAAGYAKIAEQATARFHELIDEGVPMNTAYRETVQFFNEGSDEHLAEFADDVVHKMYMLVRDGGFHPQQARVAVLAGADRAVANRRSFGRGKVGGDRPERRSVRRGGSIERRRTRRTTRERKR